MESPSKRWLYRSYSFLMPVLPTVAMAIVMFAMLASPILADGAAASREPSASLSKLPPHGGVPGGVASAKGSDSVGGILGGMTSQGWPAFLEVSNDGRQIQQAITAIDLTCTSGDAFAISDPWVAVPVARRGTFKATFHDTFVEEGVSVELSDELSGKFNRKRTKVSAKSRLQITFRGADGSVDSCDSGNVRLRARD